MENGPGLKMYVLLKMGRFHCYVSLPEGITLVKLARDLTRGRNGGDCKGNPRLFQGNLGW